jgi:hypothetical protein
LPELERKKIELVNNEIVRLVRKAIVEPGDLAVFLENIKSEQTTQLNDAPELHTTHENAEITPKD